MVVQGLPRSKMLGLAHERMEFKRTQLETADVPRGLDERDFDAARAEVGTHGEFNALNEALLGRQRLQPDQPLTPEDLPSFILMNQFSDPNLKFGPDAGAMERCQHCFGLTDGVQIAEMLRAVERDHDVFMPPPIDLEHEHEH